MMICKNIYGCCLSVGTLILPGLTFYRFWRHHYAIKFVNRKINAGINLFSFYSNKFVKINFLNLNRLDHYNIIIACLAVKM